MLGEDTHGFYITFFTRALAFETEIVHRFYTSFWNSTFY